VNKLQQQEHYHEAPYLLCVSYDEPTVFTAVPERKLRKLWKRLAARLTDGTVTQPLWGELAIVIWDLATELDRRDPG
jgi:hypothetical protein